jgi:hypothetical protein
MLRRLIPLVLLPVVAGTPLAHAAIAHDADAGSHASSGSSSLSWSHTCTGSNLILFVAVGTGNNSPSVTYNSVSMTQVASTSQSGYYTYLFYLVAPATGSHNVVVTLNSGTNVIFGQSTSYTGAKQSGVPDASTTATDAGTGNPLAPSVTTVANNAWTVASFVSASSAAPTAGTGATLRHEDHDGSPMSAALFDSDGALTPAGSHSMTMNAANNSAYKAGVMASFAPDTGGGLTTITSSDISWLGMMRVSSSGHCWSGTGAYGRIAMRYVGGTRHVLISQDAANGVLTPCEFSDTATYDTDGTCTANCPSTTLGSSPQLSFVGNWGYPSGAITAQIQISNISAANPTVVTTSSAHGFTTGQLVYIPAISGIAPSINGYWTVTVTDSTHFTIPLNVTSGGSPGAGVYVWRAYDPFHGVLGKCYGTGGNCGVSSGSTAYNDCGWYGGGGCEVTDFFIQPGSPDKLFFTYGSSYGSTYHDWSLGFCTLDTMPQSGSTSPVTTCYGPFNPESYVGQTPGASTHYTGLHAAQRILKHPDGSFDWTAAGGGASFGNQFGSSGPILFNIDAMPTTSTPQGYGNSTITAQTKWLAYYNMTCHDDDSPNCGGPEKDADGSVPSGHHIWAMRFSGYPYVWEGQPCAINSNNPIGEPQGCGAPNYYDYVATGTSYIDPLLNGGVGTWGELDRLGGAVWFQGSSKQGVLFFVGLQTNHLAGNTTACTTTIGGQTVNVAHSDYCDGQYKGESGHSCGGANDNDFGHPGDSKSPHYQCDYVDIATGPSDTFREPAILIYDPDDLASVAANGTTDYTVDPASIVYPLSDISSSMAFAPMGTNGVARSWGGCIQDPDNIHIVYCTAPQADNSTNPGYPDVVIHVFKIAG